MDKLLERHKRQSYPSKRNRLTYIVLQVFKKFKERKLQDQVTCSLVSAIIHLGTNTNSTQTLPEKIEEKMLSNSFYEATITLIPKPDRDIIRLLN